MNAQPSQVLTSITDLPHGIHADIPAEVYHRLDLGVVNKGALDRLARTPAHYRAWLEEPDAEPTPALVFGKAVHALVLEPDLFAREWALRPDFGDLRTKKAREARDAWQEEHPSVSTIAHEDWIRMHGMRDAVMRHPVAGKIFVGGAAESTAIWTDPRTGLLCKARYDYHRPDIDLLADLKSTEDASPAAFARSIAKYRYHVQDAHYTEGPHVLRGTDPRFVFVAVEKTPPYAVGVYMLDHEALIRGEELRMREMDLLVECLRTDEWPGHPIEVNTIALPNWAFSD